MLVDAHRDIVRDPPVVLNIPRVQGDEDDRRERQ
jgi:hypothetical protein